MQWQQQKMMWFLFLACVLTAMVHAPAVRADRPPSDESELIAYDNCLNETYDLAAGWGVFDNYDEGEYDAAGACAGDYYNCSCEFVQPYAAPPGVDFNAVDLGDGFYEIWWDFTNQNAPTYQTCSQCSGYSGIKETLSTWVDYNQGYDIIENVI